MIFCGDSYQIDLKDKNWSAYHDMSKLTNSDHVFKCVLQDSHRHSSIDELLEFIYLFGYLLPDKQDRDIFIQIYEAHKIYLRNAIINENIFTDWLIPFINNVNINTKKMFYLDPLDIYQFKNRLLNMLGNDYGDNQ